jgi:hypothetical protein
MDTRFDPDPVAEPCGAPAAVDPRFERRLEMLADLADIGLDLARAVAVHIKAQMVKADERWATPLPKDPSEAFARLAQTVRRTLALEVYLRQGLEAGRGGLFAGPPGRGIDLCGIDPNPPLKVVAAARRDSESPIESSMESGPRPESLQRDLGRLLDEPERLLEVPCGPTDTLIAGLCAELGLDLRRLRFENGAWIVKAEPDAPLGRDEPLKTWRPPIPTTMPGGQYEPSAHEAGVQGTHRRHSAPELRSG